MTEGYWLWKEDAAGYAPYKNGILKKWQDALRERGIEDKEYLRIYTMQITQENGALDPLVVGDNGCSLGLPQRNFCSHAGISATKAMNRWSEWKDIDFQIGWFADSTKQKLDKFGDIKWAVVAHNAPALASKRIEARYWKDVNKRSKLLEWKL